MNPIQKQLLDLADTVDLGSRTYYRLSKDLAINHPYKVKFALEQLIKKGLLMRSNVTGAITKPFEKFTGLINIPFYGEVNCGQPLSLAEDTVLSFLRISPSIINTTRYENLFALKASGWSMNKANIHGREVSDGDYLINEKIEPHQIRNGEYIISIIGGTANLKRFYKDDVHGRILLMSESSQYIPPIIISSHDADDVSQYHPIARAIEVIPSESSTTDSFS